MHIFETTSITVPYRHRCEDRVKVIDFDDGVVIVVADGAGGTGAGGEAADTVIREIKAVASLEHDPAAWCDILRKTDHRIADGQSTGVAVAWSPRGIVGASVGDGSHPPSQGLLLVGTDGFCNYVGRETLLKEILGIDFAVLARRLVEMVRLPSGELWDDIGIVACRPRRPWGAGGVTR
jgi:hypothetical protein